MDARLEKQASIRSVLFIYRCLPTHLPTYLSTYLPAPVTGRGIPRTGAYVRLATQSNRIESDLSFLPSFPPSFLPFSLDQVSRCSSLFWVSELAAASAQGRANGRRESIATTRLASTRSRGIFESKQAELDENSKRNERRGARVRAPVPDRSIDRSIDPTSSMNRPSELAPAKPTALYFALEKYPVSRIEQKRLLSLGERPCSVIINDPIHRLGFASHWFVTRARGLNNKTRTHGRRS